MDLVFFSLLEICQQLLHTCVTMLSFVTIGLLSSFLGLVSNNGLGLAMMGLDFLSSYVYNSTYNIVQCA